MCLLKALTMASHVYAVYLFNTSYQCITREARTQMTQVHLRFSSRP